MYISDNICSSFQSKPEQVSELMIEQKDQFGNYMFSRHQWLSPGSISYLFSKFAKMKKDNQLPSEIIDTAQVEEEENQRSTHQYMETLENIQTTLENPDTTPLPQQDHPKVVSLMNDDSLQCVKDIDIKYVSISFSVNRSIYAAWQTTSICVS